MGWMGRVNSWAASSQVVPTTKASHSLVIIDAAPQEKPCNRSWLSSMPSDPPFWNAHQQQGPLPGEASQQSQRDKKIFTLLLVHSHQPRHSGACVSLRRPFWSISYFVSREGGSSEIHPPPPKKTGPIFSPFPYLTDVETDPAQVVVTKWLFLPRPRPSVAAVGLLESEVRTRGPGPAWRGLAVSRAASQLIA